MSNCTVFLNMNANLKLIWCDGICFYYDTSRHPRRRSFCLEIRGLCEIISFFNDLVAENCSDGAQIKKNKQLYSRIYINKD